MNNIYVKNIFRFIILVLLQVLIFNNIHFRGYINPYVYVLFILLLPFETPPWLLLISAFSIGFFVDLYTDTMGFHAAACVFMAFFRPSVLRIISSTRDYELGLSPGIKDLGFKWFFNYSLILILIHHFAYFYLEVFTFHEFFYTFWRIIFSSAFTLIFIIIGQYLFYKKK